jgi:hypothetical protein
MVTLYQYLAICATKSTFFGKKTPQIENYDTCTVDYEKKMVFTEVKPSSADLCTPGKANKFTALMHPPWFIHSLLYMRQGQSRSISCE